MVNIVSKNLTQIRKIERGMANLPLWQLLGWPTSYTAVYEALIAVECVRTKQISHRIEQRVALLGNREYVRAPGTTVIQQK